MARTRPRRRLHRSTSGNRAGRCQPVSAARAPLRPGDPSAQHPRSRRRASGIVSAAGSGAWTQTSNAVKTGLPSLWEPRLANRGLRDRDSGHDLLLVVARVGAVVVGADRGREARRPGKRVPEVVADEGGAWRAHAEAERRVQLRVPRVKAEPDVVAFRHEVRPVELDARVDAVVRGPEGARRVESKAGSGGLGRAGGRTGH